jgi:hypothetical protein
LVLPVCGFPQQQVPPLNDAPHLITRVLVIQWAEAEVLHHRVFLEERAEQQHLEYQQHLAAALDRVVAAAAFPLISSGNALASLC